MRGYFYIIIVLALNYHHLNIEYLYTSMITLYKFKLSVNKKNCFKGIRKECKVYTSSENL